MAVEFEQPIQFRALDLGQLAAAWADWLPLSQERRVLERMGPREDKDLLDQWFESLADPSGVIAPAPRLWLTNHAGDEVVQVQHDRLVVNWRRKGSGEYPRFHAVLKMLGEAWQRLGAVCDEFGYPVPVPELCEIQYINRLGIDEGIHTSEDMASMIIPWNGIADNEFLPESYLGGFNLHCHFPQDREGWLDIDGWTTASDADEGSEIMMLNLTSRGYAQENDFESALAFFNVAHVWIVRGFAAVTSPYAHEIWGRKR